MKVKPGDILEGIDPNTNKKVLFEYIGASNEIEWKSGFKRILRIVGEDKMVIYQESYLKKFNLKLREEV